MTNVRNQFIWRPWVLVCAATFGHFFLPGKKRLIDLLNLQPRKRVLLASVGTVADQLLPRGMPAIDPRGDL